MGFSLATLQRSHSLIRNSFLLPALLLLSLSGCSTLTDKSEPSSQATSVYNSATDRTLLLTQVTQWQISGKIAFIEKDERNSATLSWQVNEDNRTQALNLTSYLGINVLQLTSKEGLHALTFDGKTYYDTNLQLLIYSLTGLTLPIVALNSWVKGLPYQENDIINYDNATQLPSKLTSTYDQSLWEISYGSYKKFGNHLLATKLTIIKGDLLIKLSIKDWQLNTEQSQRP
ncbi:lipoprotein insertase outer membrane protein LolB [Colwellia asteriadis]|uniref:Outer-membrane lipoprotein LolB n=1 Tax=Colwellia asteriadis TaxID=517723 RepID=A0ABN1L707_9GAMM